MKLPLEYEADMEKNGRTSSRQRCLCQTCEQRGIKNSFKIIFKIEAIIVGEGGGVNQNIF